MKILILNVIKNNKLISYSSIINITNTNLMTTNIYNYGLYGIYIKNWNINDTLCISNCNFKQTINYLIFSYNYFDSNIDRKNIITNSNFHLNNNNPMQYGI